MTNERRDAAAVWLLAADAGARAQGVDLDAVIKTRGVVGRGSNARVTRARRIALHITMTLTGVSAHCLGRAVGMDPATARYHAAWVEENLASDAVLRAEIAEGQQLVLDRARVLAALCLDRPEAA